MTRQQALRIIWRKLLIVFLALIALSVVAVYAGGDVTVIALTFLTGNIGGYVGIHGNLATLSDADLVELSGSWLGLIIPSFVGGILACLLYAIFISGLIAGEMFPAIEPDTGVLPDGFKAIFHQHAKGPAEYAKLFFWSFVAGFNQKYVVDVIDSIKSR
ncbi:hypothetical protein LAG73_11550 [Pseudoxanthomonas japonensis]|nr:hypothetical protein LAG73_11550 [Pseudoxanthomonas japonensis]